MIDKRTSLLQMLSECEHCLFCINYVFFDKVMAKCPISGLCHYPGCVALDIIGLIDMTKVERPLKGYLSNSIFPLTILLSIVAEHYRSLIDVSNIHI